MARLIHKHFLMVLIYRRDTHYARHHDVGMFVGFADFVNALARSKTFQFDLCGQDSQFIIIEERKERNLSQVI
jgi:hypothetical protein